MDFASLIEAHGYWVLALGCLLEGETILVLAGFAAHRGYLDPKVVVAWAAGFLGDQVYFWLGRRRGPAILARWPSLARRAERVHRLMDRYHAAVIIGIRFAYGLRTAGPVLIGMSRIPALRFTLLNALGALIWAVAFGSIGWFVGDAAEALLGEIRRLEGWILASLAAAGAGAWLCWRIRSSR